MTTESGFGKYTILERLGAGGMAEVFKCRLNGIGGFDKLVVVKRILPERMEEPEFIHMFLDEARIAANLNHPNVIHIFEVDELEGSPYMAMEYVHGPTLSALIRAAYRQKKLNLGHTAKIISGICAGLSYVHNAKAPNGVPLEIIHRDISPQNILVSVEGLPKLLDFGVAKAAGRLAKTEAGTFKGKLRYTAPELLKGQPVDARTDVYSVGVCLYEATTGRARLANNLTEAQMVSIVMEGRMELPSNVMENYPPELERIVMWAVDPDPRQRCPSAQALHQALEQFVASGPHASSTQALAKWVTELFPPSETQSYGRTPATPQTSGSNSNPARQQLGSRSSTSASFVGPAHHSDVRSYRASGSSSSGKLRANPVPPPQETEQPPDEHGAEQSAAKPVMAALMSMGLLVGLLALGGGIAYVATRGAPKAPPPAVTAPAQVAPAPQQPVAPVAAPAPAPSPLLAYLDEAERFLQERQYGPAMEMLTKAKEEPTQDAELVIRRTRLTVRAERESLLAKARMALQLNDVPAALEASKQVLDLEPSNEDALALFAEARKLEAPASARTRQTKRTGMLDITVEPGGMVYVDDTPLGLAPISQHTLPQGRHRLEVRLAGYIPLERVLRIQANKSTKLALKLVPINNPAAPPSPVVAEPGPQ